MSAAPAAVNSAAPAKQFARAVTRAVSEVVALDASVLEPVLVALVARGHVLIEGIPEIGKTLLARTLARCVDCEFNRIQFTNDLMPSDVVGTAVWRPGLERFDFVRGPLFANIVLADEFNRTSPRTLSCLLEAMEQGRVSIEGRAVEIAEPFLVLATRNPIEFHGTYPVPEAVLDRFLVRARLSYPDVGRELALYRGEDPEALLARVTPAISREELLALMRRVPGVVVSPAVAAYCYGVVAATRMHEAVALGASPRAAIAWVRAAKARAVLEGRDYVLPDDLKALARPVLTHRIFLKGGGDASEVLDAILGATSVEL